MLVPDWDKKGVKQALKRNFYPSELQLGPIFRTFFPGKIPQKIPRKIFPQKMLGKIAIFRGKSFEKSFF
jgi:hypothetical protein